MKVVIEFKINNERGFEEFEDLLSSLDSFPEWKIIKAPRKWLKASEMED